MDTGGLPGPGGPEAEAGEDLLLGRSVAGKFVLEKQLGAGAMGAVYRARQTALEKMVAIKVMHGDLARDPMFAARFHREAKAASRLDHPNSIRILDYGQDHDGLLYIAMEYLDGQDLAHILAHDWPIPHARTVSLLSQALGAIAVAHDMGITHRDLKPENIMVLRRTTDDGVGIDVVKVCDFGIAKVADSADDADPAAGAAGRGRGKLTTAGLVIGTPAYMSPEQGRGEVIDGRSDLYSMGVILYQMLTGELPFDAPSAIGLVVKHQSEVPRPPSTVRAGVDPLLESVCLKALSKAPADRYQTARELRAAIRAGMEPGHAPVSRAAPVSLAASGPVSSDAPRQDLEVVFAKTELQLAAAPTAPATVVESPAVPAITTTEPVASGARSIVLPAALLALAIGGGSLAKWAFDPSHASHSAHTAQTSQQASAPLTPPPDVKPRLPATAGETLATDERPVAIPAPPAALSGPADREGAHRATPAPPAAQPAHAATSLEPPKAGQVGTRLPSAPAEIELALPAPEVPAPPPPPPVANQAITPPPPPAAPAPPPYDVARATVEIRSPSQVTRTGANPVNALMSHLKPEIVKCYKGGLPSLVAPVEGSGTLHIETDDQGTVIVVTVSGAVREPVASCIVAKVRGGRVGGEDTGNATADVPLEFKAR